MNTLLDALAADPNVSPDLKRVMGPPSPAACKAATREDCRELVRAALVAFAERVRWWDGGAGRFFVGHPNAPVDADVAIENTMRAIWKGTL